MDRSLVCVWALS